MTRYLRYVTRKLVDVFSWVSCFRLWCSLRGAIVSGSFCGVRRLMQWPHVLCEFAWGLPVSTCLSLSAFVCLSSVCEQKGHADFMQLLSSSGRMREFRHIQGTKPPSCHICSAFFSCEHSPDQAALSWIGLVWTWTWT